MKWFVVESGRESALEVLGQVLSKPRDFAVPELFYFELAHVFHRAIPAPSETQVRLFEQVLALGIARFSMTSALLREIRKLQLLGLSGYDAAYVGLAALLGGRWLTFDRKAHALVDHLNLSHLLP
jgi:predicted nucleic acid-binding protein